MGETPNRIAMLECNVEMSGYQTVQTVKGQEP